MNKRNFFTLLLMVYMAFTLNAQVNQESPFHKDREVSTLPVENQGNTGTCWSFSATSFLESEWLRKDKNALDLSEMFWVRKIYREKAEKYIRHDGTCHFSQGGLAHDLIGAYARYGAIPESVYRGTPDEKSAYDHTALENELKAYLDTCLAKGKIAPDWKVGVEKILDKHFGEIPEVFNLSDGVYNPLTFAQRKIGLKSEDYVSITSFEHHPPYTSFILEVPDNWSNGSFHNLPLGDMMELVMYALQNGYSIEWDGDVSEPGFRADLGVAMFIQKNEDLVSLKKLPAEMPTSAVTRQAGFDSHETTDDHLMHLTGYYNDPDGNGYFQFKNSWGTSAGPFNGYLYMSDTYFRMKTVSIMVHKEAIPEHLRQKLGL